jgi:glycosyltransferase involved in cell wall biosynthesis
VKIINILFNYKKSAQENRILGVERCFVDYTKHLSLLGNKVVSVTKSKMVYGAEIKKNGFELLELPAFNRGDIFSILCLAFLCFRFDADAIICHSGRAFSFARAARFLSFRKTPIIVIDHGINPKKFLKADYVLTVNSYFSQELVKMGKDPGRALVIPNMMEVPKDFVPIEKSQFRKPIRLGSLGRLSTEKYFEKILYAMAILRDRGVECEYVIGGFGFLEQPLKDLAKQLNLEKNFKILGWVSDKKEFFEEIDIFVLPSLYETFGIVLLEAMLYSTPIITSNSWGPDEIIQDGINGLKVSKDDEKAMPELLANAIQKLNDDGNLAKQLAKQAHEDFFANYSSDVVAKKLHGIIEKIVKA